MMWSATKVLVNGAVAVAIGSLVSISPAEARHAPKSDKAHAGRSARIEKWRVYRAEAAYDRRAAHWRRHAVRTPRGRVDGPFLNYHSASGSNYYPPYGYPFTNQGGGSRRPTVGFYNSPYVQYSTSPLSGYYGWYGRLSP